MGTPVPDPFPEFLGNKWYCLGVDFYQQTEPDQGCGGPYLDRHDCCQIGWVIRAWLDAGQECVRGPGICFVFIAEPQRMISARGPYDTQEECELNCEW